jgi:(heptosyl)LPS beta-1,4-glucosyltransferase
MKKISVCIICKNESVNLKRCLESVKWADEIIIIDSGSTDNTIEIAQEYTDKIFIRADWQGFGIQRQRAEMQATNDWLFVIDCDEMVPNELQQEIITHIENANDEQVFYLNRLTKFCGQYIRHSGWYPDKIARIYNKKNYKYNDKLVHESLDCKGCKRIDLKNNLLHYQYDDLAQYIEKRNRYAQFGANEKIKKGKKSSLSKATSSALFAFIRHYFLKRGFLDGRLGFVIAVIQMQYTFNKYLFTSYRSDKVT